MKIAEGFLCLRRLLLLNRLVAHRKGNQPRILPDWVQGHIPGGRLPSGIPFIIVTNFTFLNSRNWNFKEDSNSLTATAQRRTDAGDVSYTLQRHRTWRLLARELNAERLRMKLEKTKEMLNKLINQCNWWPTISVTVICYPSYNLLSR